MKLFICLFSPQIPAWASQFRVRSQKLNQGLPGGRQETHHLMPTGMLGLQAELGLESRHSYWKATTLSCVFTVVTNIHPSFLVFSSSVFAMVFWVWYAWSSHGFWELLEEVFRQRWASHTLGVGSRPLLMRWLPWHRHLVKELTDHIKSETTSKRFY